MPIINADCETGCQIGGFGIMGDTTALSVVKLNEALSGSRFTLLLAILAFKKLLDIPPGGDLPTLKAGSRVIVDLLQDRSFYLLWDGEEFRYIEMRTVKT